MPGEGSLLAAWADPTHKKPSGHSGASIPLVLSLDGLHHIAGRSAVGTSGWHSFSRERRSGRERPPKPPNRLWISSLRTRDHPDCDGCSEPLGSLRYSQESAATALFAYSRYLKILSERELSHCGRLFYRTWFPPGTGNTNVIAVHRNPGLWIPPASLKQFDTTLYTCYT